MRMKVPKDWLKWDVKRRRVFWQTRLESDVKDESETDDYSNVTGPDGRPTGELVDRDRMTATEVWAEWLSGSYAYQRDITGTKLSKIDKKRINTILRTQLGSGRFDGRKWRYTNAGKSGPYGQEKGFKEPYF